MFLVEMEQNMENSKKLSFSQRITIENLLNQRKRKFEIANELDKSPSTITREINRHKVLKSHNIFNSSNNMFNCKYFINCKVCTGKCRIYQPISCKDRDRNIGACNNCSKLKSCKLDKYFYIAEKAQKNYEYTFRSNKDIKFDIYNDNDNDINNTSPLKTEKRNISKTHFYIKK